MSITGQDNQEIGNINEKRGNEPLAQQQQQDNQLERSESELLRIRNQKEILLNKAIEMISDQKSSHIKEENRQFIAHQLNQLKFFSDLQSKSKLKLFTQTCIQHLNVEVYSTGSILFHKGETTDKIYILTNGEILLYEEKSPKELLQDQIALKQTKKRNISDNDKIFLKNNMRKLEYLSQGVLNVKNVLKLRAGDHFGDNGYSTHMKLEQKSTFLASKSVKVITIYKEIFENLIVIGLDDNNKIKLEFLKQLLPASPLIPLVYFLAYIREKFYKYKEFIFQENDKKSNYLFIISDGEVTIQIHPSEDLKKQYKSRVELAILGKFEAFGDESLTNEPRKTDAISRTKQGVQLYYFKAKDLQRQSDLNEHILKLLERNSKLKTDFQLAQILQIKKMNKEIQKNNEEVVKKNDSIIDQVISDLSQISMREYQNQYKSDQNVIQQLYDVKYEFNHHHQNKQQNQYHKSSRAQTLHFQSIKQTNHTQYPHNTHTFSKYPLCKETIGMLNNCNDASNSHDTRNQNYNFGEQGSNTLNFAQNYIQQIKGNEIQYEQPRNNINNNYDQKSDHNSIGNLLQINNDNNYNKSSYFKKDLITAPSSETSRRNRQEMLRNGITQQDSQSSMSVYTQYHPVDQTQVSAQKTAFLNSLSRKLSHSVFISHGLHESVFKNENDEELFNNFSSIEQINNVKIQNFNSLCHTQRNIDIKENQLNLNLNLDQLPSNYNHSNQDTPLISSPLSRTSSRPSKSRSRTTICLSKTSRCPSRASKTSVLSSTVPFLTNQQSSQSQSQEQVQQQQDIKLVRKFTKYPFIVSKQNIYDKMRIEDQSKQNKSVRIPSHFNSNSYPQEVIIGKMNNKNTNLDVVKRLWLSPIKNKKEDIYHHQNFSANSSPRNAYPKCFKQRNDKIFSNTKNIHFTKQNFNKMKDFIYSMEGCDMQQDKCVKNSLKQFTEQAYVLNQNDLPLLNLYRIQHKQSIKLHYEQPKSNSQQRYQKSPFNKQQDREDKYLPTFHLDYSLM